MGRQRLACHEGQGVTFTIKSQSLTWNANGLTVEAQLPVVRAFGPLHKLPGDTSVAIVYHVPGAGHYDWTGGPPPVSNRSDLGTSWSETLRTLSRPVSLSGTDGSASDTDTLRTLFAGTLLGVAGAALIAAVQELARRSEDVPAGPSTPGHPRAGAGNEER